MMIAKLNCCIQLKINISLSGIKHQRKNCFCNIKNIWRTLETLLIWKFSVVNYKRYDIKLTTVDPGVGGEKLTSKTNHYITHTMVRIGMQHFL